MFLFPAVIGVILYIVAVCGAKLFCKKKPDKEECQVDFVADEDTESVPNSGQATVAE